MIDLLIVSTRAVGLPDGKEGEVVAAALKKTAEDFLVAGGIVSLAEWAALGPASRAALVAAGVECAKDRAALLAGEILRQQVAGVAGAG